MKQNCQELSDNVDEFRNAIKGKLGMNLPLNPEVIAAAAKVVSKALKAGTLNFAAMMENVTARQGEKMAERMRGPLQQAWDQQVNSDPVTEDGKPPATPQPHPELTQTQYASLRSNTQPRQQATGWGGCIIVVVLCGVLWLGNVLLDTKVKKPEVPETEVSHGQLPSATTPSRPYVSQPEVEPGQLTAPRTGVIQKYHSSQSVAPLEIRTRSGSGHYYVKISRIVGDRLILSKTAFIRDGGTISTTMPLGDYEIRYAVGKNWYGTDRLFGKSTSFAKADDVFSFEETSQGYSGFSIELYRQLNGNLEIAPLTADEF